MAKLSVAQQKAMLYIQSRIQKYGFCHRHAPTAFGNIVLVTIKNLAEMDLIEIDMHHIVFTPAGLAYLYQDAPMVDQPQPAPEVEPVVNLSAALLLEAVRKFGDFMPE